MTWYKPTKAEWISFLGLMPFLTTGCNYLLFNERFLSSEVLIQSNAIMYGVGLLAWYNHVAFTHHINNKYRHFSQINQRVLWLLILHVIVMTTSFSVYFIGYDHLGFLGYQLDVERYVWGLIAAFYITSVATTSWGFNYTVKQAREELMAKEVLAHQNLQAESEVIRSQVSPHFLYNSLNSLSALVEEDTQEAEVFVDELSKVFRYLLHETENGLTPLARELDFINSYFYLLKKRHGAGIDLQVEVHEQWLHYQLPAHTLQVLVENAVKYNKIDKQTILVINIRTTGSPWLQVSNCLQKKLISIDESGYGLSRLRSRYAILKKGTVKVLELPQEFVVELPLLAPGGSIP